MDETDAQPDGERLDDEAAAQVERRLEALLDDPEARRRFDRDGDGELDDRERELARRAMEMEVLRERRDPEADGREQAGEVLRSRYELMDRIGAGGQGVTWRARDRRAGEDGQAIVVVKELAFSSVEDWKSWELFERESHTLRTLDHPNIPDYVDHFREVGDQGERFFLVQQFVEGESLEWHLEQGWRFDEETVQGFLRDLLETLAYLHEMNPPVVHRDLKPSNLILRPDGGLSVVDFGAVQRALPDTVGGSTVVGTSGYIPPEQLMGRARPSTDIYALGATIIHLLSHRHPNDIPVVRMRLDFADLVDAEPGLVKLLERMVEPAVEDRFDGAGAALAALERLERGDALPALRDGPEGETQLPAPRSHRFVSSGLTVENEGDVLNVELPGTRTTFRAVLWNLGAVAVGPFACCSGVWAGDNPSGGDSLGIMLLVTGSIWLTAVVIAQVAHRWSGRIQLIGDRFRLTQRFLGIPYHTIEGSVDELRSIAAKTRESGPAQQRYPYTVSFQTQGDWIEFDTKIRADDAEALERLLRSEAQTRGAMRLEDD